MNGGGRGLGVALVAVVGGLAAGALLCLAIGEDPGRALAAVVRGVFADRNGVGAVLFDATALSLTGLSVAFASRAGLFNIGAEGQLTVGAFAAATLPLAFPSAPAVLLVPAAVLAAIVAGGAWGAVPGLLRAHRGGHEVLNTIMMNFIAAGLTGYLTVHLLRPAGEMIPHTPEIVKAAWIPRLGAMPGSPIAKSSPANVALFLAIAAAILVAWTLSRTSFGFRVRARGEGERASRVAGMPTAQTTVLAMTVAGALAGLAGVNEVLGFRHRFLDNFAGGVGYLGIAVALLGRGHVGGVLIAALWFATLNAAAVEVDLSTDVPRELFLIVQAVILVLAASGDDVVARLMRHGRRT